MLKRAAVLLMASAVFAGTLAAAPKTRLEHINPVGPGEIRLRPTFNSCGFYFGSPELKEPVLEFRKSGEKEWQTALTPVYFTETGDYRGSIVKLEENTGYEVRLHSEGLEKCAGAFQTWSSEVPVARTITIDAATFSPPLKICVKGSPEGWVRYIAAPGTVLENKTDQPAIIVAGARYVLLDGLTIKGGNSNHSIIVGNSSHIRIQNCDISGWGRVGVQRFDRKGAFYEPASTTWNKLPYVDYNAAILLKQKSSEVVVERCYIHDPRNRANSWFYSHPHGPEAVLLERPEHSTVIRYNDFIGSDEHPWNDAVEGIGNFDEDGGFNRDADIYGNFMIFANDDNIELDGGQQNVRCFWNRFEAALCGVSIQGCMVSPVYVFENLFSGMGEEFGDSGQTIKTGGGAHGKDATAFFFNNTLRGPGIGIIMMSTLKCVIQNNIFADSQRIHQQKLSPQSVIADNSIGRIALDPADFAPEQGVPGGVIPNFSPAGAWRGAVQKGAGNSMTPYRPFPVRLDRERIDGVVVKEGKVTPASVKITAAVGGKDFSGDYTIRRNEVFDWFEVTPASGKLSSGDRVEFTIRFKPEKMNRRRHYRGAFILRMADGLSRPVSVYAKTDFVQQTELHKPGETAIYIDPQRECVLNAADGKAETLTCKVDIPKDGRYYFMIHGYGKSPFLQVAVDDDEFESSRQQTSDYPTWTMLTPGRKFGNMLRHYDLKAGTHTLRLKAEKGEIRFDRLVATDSPGSFEPK